MKKIKIGALLFLLLLLPFSVKAVNTTNKLYQDITIEENGDIFIKEIAVLSGSYNGRLRDITYRNDRLTAFTGKASDFEGSSIYNGEAITDLKIFDILNSYSITMESFQHLNKEYTLVNRANKGDYGVYTMEKTTNGIDLMIYNPSSSNTAFYMEYRVKNAVVLHNDVAELYWNLLGDSYEENITDFQAVVHLPGEDSDFRTWLHGPLYGKIEHVDSRSAKATFSNLDAYESISVRLMFNKSLVPLATKKSNIDGRNAILEIEKKYADQANLEREKQYDDLVNNAKQYMEWAEKYLDLDYYNTALNLVNSLKEEDKGPLLDELTIIRGKIEIRLQEEVEEKIALVEQSKSKTDLQALSETISLLQPGTIKQGYKEKYDALKIEVENHYRMMQRNIFFYFLIYLGIIVLIHAVAFYYYDKKNTTFHEKYYRDFPYDYGPGMIEYIMKKKITAKTFSAMILDFIRKDVITMEEITDSKGKKDYLFKSREKHVFLSKEEIVLKSLLFHGIGNDHQVTMKQIKDFGKTEDEAKFFLEEYGKIGTIIKDRADSEKYFTLGLLPKITSIIISILGFNIFLPLAIIYDSYWVLLFAILTIIGNIIYVIVKKYRTKTGKEHYDKWKAHKRFLLDFGRFSEKELPEVHLWEQYLVTATVLGCADKVQKAMQIHLEAMQLQVSEDMSTTSLYGDMVRIQMLHNLLDTHFSTVMASTVNHAVQNAHYQTLSDSSYTSSSGGFGGGSVGGGGFGGGGGGGGRF